jgi:hypothetical protein
MPSKKQIIIMVLAASAVLLAYNKIPAVARVLGHPQA